MDAARRQRAARLPAALLCPALIATLAGCGGDDGPRSGAELFADSGCGACHALSEAEAEGARGADLDRRRISAAAVTEVLREGTEGMPAYASRLTDAELGELARFVARSSGP